MKFFAVMIDSYGFLEIGVVLPRERFYEGDYTTAKKNK